MAARRIVAEWAARLLIVLMVLGVPLLVVVFRGQGDDGVIEVRAAMPEAGGWLPGDLQAQVGEPLNLRLTSTDVVHGFAVGQSDLPPVDLHPGEIHELSLTFDQPGSYTYYCTRWCGVNHWRMRGTIEVFGPDDFIEAEIEPLYLALGLDLDAPREIQVSLDQKPSAVRGAALNLNLPSALPGWDAYVSQSPYQRWQALRNDPITADLNSDQVWDLVAYSWQINTTPEGLANGRQLYAENCSACHGETGQGDGVMAAQLLEVDFRLNSQDGSEFGHEAVPPTDFTDSKIMLSASPALMQGKILRGGMGTGMPYWGPIFTAEETWDLVAYLWTFQFVFDPQVW